ncbi:uncharacterized bromodomain-containing protein 10-like isoform X2 [Palaemon carinicauda]
MDTSNLDDEEAMNYSDNIEELDKEDEELEEEGEGEDEGEVEEEEAVEEEEELEEEEEIASEEEFEESFRDEGSKSETIEEEKSYTLKEIERKGGLMSLYSGMNDIISEPSSISNSPVSTPTVTPTKSPGNTPSRLQAALTSSLSYKSSGGGLLVHHPVTPKKRVINKTNTEHLSEELSLGHRILMELMSDYQKGSNAPFMEPIEMDKEKNGDYLEVVEKPMWLKKIKEQLIEGKYTTITELIGDIRTMLENAYRYYGPSHSISKKGLRLEHMMEQKITLLPKEVRELCTLEKTSGTAPEDITQKHRNKTARISVNGDNFFSYVLYRVRGCRHNRDKEMKKRRMEALRQAKKDREQEVVVWEEKLLEEPVHTHMRAMWELPQIGHFIFLTLKTLNIYEVPQFELERMLLMPQASRSLAMLLTSLLSSPQQRQKLGEKPYMPYKVWARKLAHKTLLWYRCYFRENQDSQKVFDQMGIEPQFWHICGPSNPFDRQLFHEMTFHQRVWLLKSLCDYLLNNHKTVQEVISEQPEADQREYNLGRDRNGNEYLHFPQFCGQSLRIYRRARVPSPEIPPQEEEVLQGSILPLEKIKEFRKMIKKYRHKYEEEAEWEGARGKKKRKRRRANRVVDPEEEVPAAASRSRPGNLRQRPRARYNDQYEDLGLSSDDEPKAKPKSRKSRSLEYSSDEEELPVENNEPVDTPPPPSPTPNDPEDETTNSSLPSVAQEGVNRAQQKNPKVKKGGKRKPTCELCGKSFHTIAALKGHRAVHTKEKKLANEAESKRLKQAESTTNSLEEKTDDSKCNGAKGVAQNGECDFSDKSESIVDSELKNLKSESLINGVIKQERVDGHIEDKAVKCENVKTEQCDSADEKLKVKEEQIDIKEENVDLTEVKKEDSDKQCNGELVSTKIKSEDDQRTENGELKNDVNNSLSCNGSAIKEETEGEENSSSKPSTPVPPTEPKPIHDPSPYLPRIEDFELVVTSVEQLRALVKRFGDLPEGSASSNNENDENSKEEAKPEKRPSCEVKLHRALCNLLSELSPWETKLLSANKRLRTKLRNEWNDFVKRGDDYVDPAEEAWMSDPEPDPEPPAATPQPSSSSSSSSEESLDEEGNPKRKLRKRRAKRQAVAQMMENVPPPVETPIAPVPQENPESYAVSSRGRVRKVKKIINYDGLDFEKLALQASLEAEEEKVRRKRKREEEEKEREQEESSRSNYVSFGGVKRYLLSQSGHITNYIDNEGQVRSANASKDNRGDKGRVDISSVRNLAGQLVTNAKKESPKTPVRHVSSITNRLFQNTNVKPDVPCVIVAAYDNQGSPVNVRVVGEQALQLVKYMKPGTKGPVTEIKLQHHGQTYTVNTNAQISTKNIPGIPNGGSFGSPTPSVIRSTASASEPTSTLGVSRPSGALGGLITSNSPSVPRVAPISTVVTSSTSSPPNTIAQAYRGLTRPSRPVIMTSGLAPQGSVVRSILSEQTRPHTATTRLVTASPSVVSSVMPPGARTSVNVTSPVHTAQVARPNSSTILGSQVRPAASQVVNRIAGVPAASAVVTSTANVVQSPAPPVVQEQVISQQVPVQTVATSTSTVMTQPQGQAITAATVVVPAAGGQPQLKLESESLAQLMQRTGSKIVAMPNGRGGYTLSLTPGVVPPGQKVQTHVASNTAAKVQVVTSAPASLLQDPPTTVQQVIQQQTLSPTSAVRPAAVVQGISRSTGVQALSTQQVGLRQVIPVNQTTIAGSVIKTNNVVTQGTQLVLNSGQQTFTRVATQPRVYSNLVTAQSTPQQTRTSTGTVATVLAPQQNVNTIVSSNQQLPVLQHAVVHKSATVQSQTPGIQTASGQQQYVVQQRVLAQPTGTPQVVRLQQANPSQPGNAGQRLTVQIVQQPGGGQQVVQMVPQVVSQAAGTPGQQSLIYVQGTGQVIAQQAKTTLSTVQQPQSQTHLQSPQQGHIAQVSQQQVVQVAQPQQQVVQVAQARQQQVVQVAQSQHQQQIVQVTQPQHQQQVVQVAQPQPQHQVVQVAQPQQQQVVQVAQPQQQQVVQVAQSQQQQVVQVAQPQQQQQQAQQTTQQTTQGRLVLVRTQQGEQMALHHPDGRLTFLTQEIQAALRSNTTNSQPAST